MFERNYLTRHNTTNINIEQQPNDAADAARLYGELQEKAQSSVVEVLHKKVSSSINVEYVQAFQTGYENYDPSFVVCFKINGQKFTAKAEYTFDDKMNDRNIFTKIGESITEVVFNEMVKKDPHLIQSFGRQMMK